MIRMLAKSSWFASESLFKGEPSIQGGESIRSRMDGPEGGEGGGGPSLLGQKVWGTFCPKTHGPGDHQS